jgi:ABC-type transport system involved in Fe-S cluster assembly fused permease/ATPase subunit
MKFDTSKSHGETQFWKTVASLLPYIWPANRGDLKVRVILALVSLVIAKGFNVGVPFLLKAAIDQLSALQAIGAQAIELKGLFDSQGLSLAIGLTAAYALARIGHQAFSEFRDFIFAKVAQHTQRAIGLKTFEHLHSLSLGFHLDRQTGGLSRVIERGTRGIQTVLQFMLFNILPTIVEVLVVCVVLAFTFGVEFTLITAATIVAYVIYTIQITNWRVKFRKDMMQRDTEANTKAIDSLLNFETVKYFGNEQHEHRRFDQALAGYEAAALQSQTSLSILNLGQGLIIALGLVGVMGLAAWRVGQGVMTVGDFVAVNTFLIQLYMPLNILGFAYRETTQSLVEMEKMFELLDVERDIKDSETAANLKLQSGEVEFQNVSFHYHPDRPILRGVSFKIPPGKTVALVGPSGGGKSTVSRLLFRFYDPQGGRILIDGQNIAEITQSSLRAAIGIVPQDTVLFNDTMEYNILYGRPAASPEEVREAASLARLGPLIQRLPEGLRALVGERGLKLSGGEKQRVAIARTILKRPQILIFDEATSALDTSTEQEINRSLREVSQNRTTLVIAHRLSTIVDADEILCLKDGQIVERGQHSELLAKNGEYARMWRLQAEYREAQERLNLAAQAVRTTT